MNFKIISIYVQSVHSNFYFLKTYFNIIHVSIPKFIKSFPVFSLFSETVYLSLLSAIPATCLVQIILIIF
jgi:hypothetical protein